MAAILVAPPENERPDPIGISKGIQAMTGDDADDGKTSPSHIEDSLHCATQGLKINTARDFVPSRCRRKFFGEEALQHLQIITGLQVPVLGGANLRRQRLIICQVAIVGHPNPIGLRDHRRLNIAVFRQANGRITGVPNGHRPAQGLHGSLIKGLRHESRAAQQMKALFIEIKGQDSRRILASMLQGQKAGINIAGCRLATDDTHDTAHGQALNLVKSRKLYSYTSKLIQRILALKNVFKGPHSNPLKIRYI